MKKTIYLGILILMLSSLTALKAQKIEGELKKWYRVTLVFDGPECSETGEFNPFLNYWLNEYFFKCGPDAPENFLAYYAFDGDFMNDGHKDNLVKQWEAHLMTGKKEIQPGKQQRKRNNRRTELSGIKRNELRVVSHQ